MRYLLALLLLGSSLFAATRAQIGGMFGIPANLSTSGGGTFALNAAATGGYSANWVGQAMVFAQSKTVNTITFLASTVTIATSLGANDIVCDIYSDTYSSFHQPGASLATTNTVVATPTAGSNKEITCNGLSYTVSANTMYWLVLRNANASPTTNNFTVRFGSLGFEHLYPAMTGNAVSSVVTSTASGSPWSTSANNTASYMVGFSDGTYSGFPPYSTISGGVAASSSYDSTHAAGVTFTTPANVKLVVAGASLPLSKVGSPTGALTIRLYQGTTKIAETSTSLDNTYFSSSNKWMNLYFDSSITLNPSTTYSLVLWDNGTDSTSNYYTLARVASFSAAQTNGVIPYNSLLVSYNGTSFTTQASTTPLYGLLLDVSGDYAATGTSQTGYAY